MRWDEMRWDEMMRLVLFVCSGFVTFAWIDAGETRRFHSENASVNTTITNQFRFVFE